MTFVNVQNTFRCIRETCRKCNLSAIMSSEDQNKRFEQEEMKTQLSTLTVVVTNMKEMLMKVVQETK